MGRSRRLNAAGAKYHVYMRGNRREPIFRTDADFECFLLFFGDEIERRGWRCLAYCLIPNHAHLLFETPEANLSEGMQRLNLRWAKRFNKAYELVGHVFQGRFGSELVADERYFRSLLRYIALNPVNAGVCRNPSNWPWSSYAEIVGSVPPRWLIDLERLCELLQTSRGEAAARLASLAA